MKLSFSTRGWEKVSWEENVHDAADLQFSGIELYNPHKQKDWKEPGSPFHQYQQNETIRELRKNHLTVPCLDTSIDLSTDILSALDETIPDLMDLASAFRIPYLAFCALGDCEENVRASLDRLLLKAAEKKICILLKTVGIYADTKRLRALLDDYASDDLACLWDMHHPYRDYQEKPDTTIRNLGGYVQIGRAHV